LKTTTIKHPDPANKCQFEPIGHKGIQCGELPDKQFYVYEGDFITYSYPEDDFAYLGRVLCRTTHDGVGTECRDPSFGVLVMSPNFDLVYFRIIEGRHVSAAAAAIHKGNQFLKWFMCTPQIRATACETFLRMMKYTHLTPKTVVPDECNNISPPPAMCCHQSDYIPDKWINSACSSYESWLNHKGYKKPTKKQKASSEIPATRFVDKFLDEVPQPLSLHSSVKFFAEEIGGLI
jgi:hypothetical protein